MLTAEDAVNQYLIEHHEMCLEEVLSDAVDGRMRQEAAEVVQVTASCLDRSREGEGQAGAVIHQASRRMRRRL
jgi:hypothetical protein